MAASQNEDIVISKPIHRQKLVKICNLQEVLSTMQCLIHNLGTNSHSQTEHSTRATRHLKQYSQVLDHLHLVKAGLSCIRDRQWARNIIDT